MHFTKAEVDFWGRDWNETNWGQRRGVSVASHETGPAPSHNRNNEAIKTFLFAGNGALLAIFLVSILFQLYSTSTAVAVDGGAVVALFCWCLHYTVYKTDNNAERAAGRDGRIGQRSVEAPKTNSGLQIRPIWRSNLFYQKPKCNL